MGLRMAARLEDGIGLYRGCGCVFGPEMHLQVLVPIDDMPSS